jgi:DNA-binding MarR family transcriptional regulator
MTLTKRKRAPRKSAPRAAATPRALKRAGELRTFRTLASFRLHVLARLSERFYERLYQREFGLSLLECRMIGITGGFGQVSFKRVCEEANLDKSHASRLIHRLIKRRLLQKVSNPSDQRSVMLGLSPSGRETHRALHARASQTAEQWLSALSGSARRIFTESLVLLTDKIRAMGDEATRKPSRRTRAYGPAKISAQTELPLREVVVNRRMARQLYDLLGTALADPAIKPAPSGRRG